MRQLVQLVALLSLSVAPSHAGEVPAGEGRLYLGGQGGMFLPIESSVSGGGLSGKLSYHPGLVLAAVAGYEAGKGIRGEAELNFRKLTTDRLTTGATVVAVDSDIWTCGFMTNVYYDFRNRSAVTPYLGGGVGLIVAEFGRGTSNGTTLWPADRDLSIAYQGMAGFALQIDRQSSLDFVYHHYAVPSLHFDTLAAKFRGINLSAGLRHRF
ncbi:MAG: hypothetical protein A2075_11150 [Geobacteraceae bacterium GWC2_58_44]|nr:MAG: hypothetical protein A2075_11150 [Geobacteraceae bacterium GWC2_58_44]HBG05690.1 hypothetical protein [Geobacter sp.]